MLTLERLGYGHHVTHIHVTAHPTPAHCSGLAQSYFYEEDSSQPDNRVEKILSAMEGVCSVTFKKLFAHSQAVATSSDPRRAAATLQALITNDDVDNLSQFAAYQYMRVPGAIDQKTSEVQPSEISESERAHALNPGRFVESGYIYVRDRFRAMKLLIFASPGRDFITSDWPCFDMKARPTARCSVRKSAEIRASFAICP
jgi:hypothetical protein